MILFIACRISFRVRTLRQITDFLRSANSKKWPAAEMRSMRQDHLNLTMSEVVARLVRRLGGDVSACEKVHNRILRMADGLSMGIIKQSPNEFMPSGCEHYRK